MNRIVHKPTIVLVAIESKIYDYLNQFIGTEYQLFPVDHVDDFSSLAINMDICLFLLDTDKTWLGTKEIMQEIKSNPNFHNIPVIGLALKQHFSKMSLEEKHHYEDFLLIPCSNEDMLTRIEVWTRTYKIMCRTNGKNKKYSLDEIR